MKFLQSKIKLVLLMVLLATPVGLYAQGPGFDDEVVDEVPLDGGVSLLIAAGVGYGIKKLKDSKRIINKK